MDDTKQTGTRGGKREGAGRPYTDDPKEKVWLSFNESYINKNGGKEKLKEKIYKLLKIK
jgi:hypothetical protein